MIIDGNRMYRATVERESFAAVPRKSVGHGAGDGRLYLASGMEAELDLFFNRDANADEDVFRDQNGYYVNLAHLRAHVVLSVAEWTQQITGTNYVDVKQAAYAALLAQIDERIRVDGEIISLGQMQRRAGGIAPTRRGAYRVYIRPAQGARILGWELLRLAILRTSRIYIERHPNANGGMDYFFGLEVHPDFHQQMGGGQFDLLQEIVEQEPGVNPQDVEDTRRRVVQEQTVRDGARAFRDSLRAAYADICAVTGYDEPRAMDAAHIMRYRGGQTNHVTNGMLLRVDIHRLFDRRSGPLLRIEIQGDEWRLRVDPSLMDSTYAELDGALLHLPDNPEQWPNMEALRMAGWLVD